MSGFSLRLSHKIIALGAIGVVGLISFGAIYLYGSGSEDAQRSTANRAQAISDLNRQLSTEMLEARRAEKDFQLRHDRSYATRHGELTAVIRRDLGQLKALAQSAGFAAVAEQVEALRGGFDNYVTEFAALEQAEVKLGLNETMGLSGSLRAAVHDIEAKLKERDNSVLVGDMLMMRRHEKDFMLRRDAKYVGELKKAAAEFAKALASAGFAPELQADLMRKLEKYQADFLSWVDGAQDAARHGEAMSKQFHQIEPVIVEIAQGVDQRYRMAQAAEADMRSWVKMGMLIAFGLALFIVSGASFAIGRSISRVIMTMVRAMSQLARGETTIEIPSLGRQDEIGEMAGAVQVFKTNMIEADRLRTEQAAVGQRQAEHRRSDMRGLADRFEAAIGEIVETVSSASTELEASAATLTKTAERTREVTTAVAVASEEASTNVNSVASATEELSSSVNEISRQVQESARMASEAVGQARTTTDRVRELSKAAARIGDVVELINTIAGQTNLLALNATIEAARAGQAGRGFAVVASEVKALAEQTAKATGEIGQQISGIQAATEDSVIAIRDISGTIERLSEISSTIAAAVEEQGAATQEISRNVQHAAEGTNEVSSNITEVQRGSAETGSASSRVLSAAQSLSSDSNRLKLEVGKFLNSVRAA